MPFHSLPPETLLQIFSYFCVHCYPQRGSYQFDENFIPYSSAARARLVIRTIDDLARDAPRKTLRDLCLVDRRTRQLAQPLLFHCLDPHEHPVLPLLFRDRPDLAQAVRVLNYSSPTPLQDQRFAKDNLAVVLQNLSGDAPDVTGDPWRYDLLFQQFRDRLILELLLSRLPSLERITDLSWLDSYRWGPNPLLNNVSYLWQGANKAVEGATVLLPRLRSAQCEGLLTERPGLALLLKNAPEVEEIVLTQPESCGDFIQSPADDEEYEASVCRLSLRRLKTLRFQESGLCLQMRRDFLWLRGFLQATDRLETFQYTNEYGDIAVHPKPSAAPILQLLIETGCHRTITSLQLRIGDPLGNKGLDDVDGAVFQGHEEPLGPLLAQFPRLRRLEIDEIACCRHWLPAPATAGTSTCSCMTSLLPPTLEEFHIWLQDDTKLENDMEALRFRLLEEPGLHPHLTRMIVSENSDGNIRYQRHQLGKDFLEGTRVQTSFIWEVWTEGRYGELEETLNAFQD